MFDGGVAHTADVVVVGGGLIGTATAFEAAAAGQSAVLVDRHDPGRATDAGAGILSAETSPVGDAAWFDLAVAAAEHYRQLVSRLEETTGLDDRAYSRCGLLCLALHENEVSWFEERLATARSRTTNGLREVTAGWSNIFVATGHGTEGLLLGPYTGRLVAALVGGTGLPPEAHAPLLEHFSAARFER